MHTKEGIENQLALESALKPKRRTLSRRRHHKRLTAQEKPGAIHRWLSQHMLKPYLAGAQIWERNLGAQIGYSAGSNVEEGAAEQDKDNAFSEISKAIAIARADNIPAKDIIDALFSQTTVIADKVHNRLWPSTYFGEIVDIVVAVYPTSEGYGEELKSRFLTGKAA